MKSRSQRQLWRLGRVGHWAVQADTKVSRRAKSLSERHRTGGGGPSFKPRLKVVHFERASKNLAKSVVLQYDRRETLVAMGILPAPTPQFARHDPNPFPGAMRFAPDPNP